MNEPRKIYAIDQALCARCGMCSMGCPVTAIRRREKNYVILEDECIGCGLCARSCPAHAIAQKP